MNLQQLRYVVEIVRHGNHLSAAAAALRSSQPGVSRQIQLLEAELGFEIFTRTRNRIIGLTEPGKIVLSLAQRVATDVTALKRLKEEMYSGDPGHLHHRHHPYPGALHAAQCGQGLHPALPQCEAGAAPGAIRKKFAPWSIPATRDLAIGTETTREFPNLVKLDCFELERCVVAPLGHPILSVPNLTLAEIAKYPIITYDTRYSGRWKVMKAFTEAGLEPKIIMSGIDADVCKTYVGVGLGIGILTSLTFDEKARCRHRGAPRRQAFAVQHDQGLAPAEHLSAALPAGFHSGDLRRP